MNKKVFGFILIIVMSFTMFACSKTGDNSDDEAYLGEELIGNVEETRLNKDKNMLSELAYNIRITLVEGYGDVNASLTRVRVDGEGRIIIAALFDTTTEEGQGFVNALHNNLGTEYIELSSKMKEDCTVFIEDFDGVKGEFTIQVESEKCEMKFYIDQRGKIHERS